MFRSCFVISNNISHKSNQFSIINRNKSSIEILLIKDVLKQGKAGETIKVRRGFARNCLIPKRLAVYITEDNLLTYAHLIKKDEINVTSNESDTAITESIDSILNEDDTGNENLDSNIISNKETNN